MITSQDRFFIWFDTVADERGPKCSNSLQDVSQSSVQSPLDESTFIDHRETANQTGAFPVNSQAANKRKSNSPKVAQCMNSDFLKIE